MFQVMLLTLFPLANEQVGKGYGTYEGTRFDYEFSAAAYRPNEFDPEDIELAVVVSDWPLSAEDVADGVVQHDVSRLDFVFRKGKIWRVTFLRGMSETSFGDQLKFDGTVSDRIKGRIFTDGEVDVMGSAIVIDVNVDVAVVDQKTLDKRVTHRGAAVQETEWMKGLQALLLAVAEDKADDAKAQLSKAWVRAIDEEMYGQVSMLSYGWDMPESYSAEKVSVHENNARLYLKAEDRIGVVKFVKEGGSWKFDDINWRYTW